MLDGFEKISFSYRRARSLHYKRGESEDEMFWHLTISAVKESRNLPSQMEHVRCRASDKLAALIN